VRVRSSLGSWLSPELLKSPSPLLLKEAELGYV
jgi:hypothetical protein